MKGAVMPQAATQATRHIAIETPLGEDVLLLQGFFGHEELSRLFEFDLDLLSENYEINFDDIIGQNVTIRMDLLEGGTRYWNGFINRFTQGVSTSVQFAQYRAKMVPWLWFLTQTSDCRIFQERTVPDIIRQVFNDHGFSDIEDRLSGGYRTWKYCVQYRETDYNFVNRLMEQEGIYYYFFHEQGKCTLVLCDSLSKHDPYENYRSIDFAAETRASAVSERINEWTVEKKVRSGKFAHVDYNFEKPSTSLMSIEEDQKTHARSDYEIFDFPGEYLEKADGDRYAKMRMEELSYSHELCTGQSDARGICAGHLFTLERHTRRDQNKAYLVISTDYQVAAQSYETSRGNDQQCVCFFSVIPASVQFRPERNTPKPVIQGSQTAVVTGPSGEEIYTDEHGRVKVQFHWDREATHDENSSCWIRVSQVHAGKSFGGIDIPRIGEEVIVSFMEGDPDQPIITGRVYNAESMPPFGLPGKKVVSGMKSNSTPGGGGYNEISLNDTKGQEGLTIHAQYNMDTTVENDQTLTVHNNRDSTVDVDETQTVGNNQTISIGSNQETTVGSMMIITTGSSQTMNIGSDQTINVSSNQMEAVGASKTVTVSGNMTIETGGNLTISAGSSIAISSPKIIITGGAAVDLVCGGTTLKLDPGSLKTIAAAITTTAGASHEIKGAIVKNNC
jgi:type VI secretion system secreted protein VgrG